MSACVCVCSSLLEREREKERGKTNLRSPIRIILSIKKRETRAFQTTVKISMTTDKDELEKMNKQVDQYWSEVCGTF